MTIKLSVGELEILEQVEVGQAFPMSSPTYLADRALLVAMHLLRDFDGELQLTELGRTLLLEERRQQQTKK